MFEYNDLTQLHVELSSMCNAACPGCPRNIYGGYTLPAFKEKQMSLELFKSIIDNDILKNITRILFCGNYGDPITCNDIIEILKYCSSVNPDIHIIIHTNGSLRTIKFWKEIASTNNNRLEVIFSIDGLEDTNKIYRRNTNWNKIIENAKTFINVGGVAIWEYLAFKHNEHQINKAKSLSIELGFKQFRLKKAFGFEQNGQMKVLNSEGNYQYTIFPPTTKSITNISAKPVGQIDNIDVPPSHIQNNKNVITYNEYTEISCLAKNGKEIYIDVEGGVHPCCFLGHVSVDSPGYINQQYKQFSNNFNTKMSIKEALSNNSYFNKIEESWSKTYTGNRIKMCSVMCSVKHNQLDDLYANDNKPNKKHKF